MKNLIQFFQKSWWISNFDEFRIWNFIKELLDGNEMDKNFFVNFWKSLKKKKKKISKLSKKGNS